MTTPSRIGWLLWRRCSLSAIAVGLLLRVGCRLSLSRSNCPKPAVRIGRAQQLTLALDEIANLRVHGTTKAVPALRLVEERAVMLPAPALRAAAALPQRVALPLESLQHPLAVYDALLGPELLEVFA